MFSGRRISSLPRFTRITFNTKEFAILRLFLLLNKKKGAGPHFQQIRGVKRFANHRDELIKEDLEP